MNDFSCLVFSVYNFRFGIPSHQVYRVDQFDSDNLESVEQNKYRYYHIGDYIVTLDWMVNPESDEFQLNDVDKLILYRVEGKIRGLPVTRLEQVVHFDINNLSLRPKVFRILGILPWVALFHIEGKTLLPILELNQIETYNFSKTDGEEQRV